jgi:hypothetical protein
MLADEMKALSDDTQPITVPPFTPFAHGLPDVLENSPHRFALTNGDGWEVSFFYYPFAAEAFIVGFRDGKHRRHTSDGIAETKMIVEYDKWIPVELARDYWRYLLKCGCKRIK